MSDIDNHIDAHAETYIGELRELLNQPSISAQNIGITEMATMVEQRFRDLGATVRQIPLPGGNPIVYAEFGGTSDRVLSFYNHYDVQPPEPLELWESDPWEAEIRDGRLWARGVADNKGNLSSRLAAIDAWQKTRGPLPLKLKFIVEGEEEIGSPHLMDFAKAHPDLCQADACIWESGGRGIDGRPSIQLGLKGICYVELRAKGARHDWHSAVATSVPNPAWRLVWALKSLKALDERVQIAGFYDAVVAPTEAELRVLADMPDTEAARLENLGIDQFLGGRTGVELNAWDYFHPTCTISGFESGYHEAGMKTVLPSTATVKLDMRLVANQDPFVIYDLLRKYLDENGFTDIETEALAQQYPARTPLDAPIAQVVADAYRDLYGQEPVFVPTSLGSGPLYQLCAQFGIDAATSGAGNARSQVHAPNENVYVDDFVLAIKHVCQIIERFASLDQVKDGRSSTGFRW